MIPAAVVTAVDRPTETVFVGCAKERIENAPEYVPEASDGSDASGPHKMKFADYYLAFFR